MIDADGAHVAANGVLAVGEAAVVEQKPEARRIDLFELVDGRALVPHVALGAELTVRGWSGEVVLASSTVRAPTRAGERIELRLAASGPTRQLVGRVVAPDGAVLADRRLFVQVDGRDSVLHTGGEGALRVRLPSGARAATTLLLSTERLFSAHSLGGSFPLPAAPLDGATELGTLVLRPHVLLASGTVLGDHGRPVPGASLRIDDGPRAHVGWGWPAADASGRFALYGLPGVATSGALHAEQEGHDPSPSVHVPLGTADVRLVLPPRTGVRGHLRLGPLLELDDLQLWLTPQGAAAHGGHTLDHDGSFVFFDVEPGTYDLSVGFGFEGPILYTVSGIEVDADGALPEPRLAAIDLASSVRSIDVHVVDADGQLVPGVTLTWRPSSGGGAPHRTRLAQGRRPLVVPAVPLDLTARAEGYREAQRTGVVGNTRITLQRAD